MRVFLFLMIFWQNSDSSYAVNSLTEKTCQNWSDSASDLWSWISSQKNKQLQTFCNVENDENFHRTSGEDNLFVKGPFECPDDGSIIEFQGQLNSKNLPNGAGRFKVLFKLNQAIA